MTQPQNILQKFPGWGYTQAIAGDAVKKGVVDSMVREFLTDLRSDIKQVVSCLNH